MLNAITTKIEIDCMQVNEVDMAAIVAVEHAMPAMIVTPQLIQAAIQCRIRRGGSYKIIAPVDWPKGDNFGASKMRGMTHDMIGCDGFEVLMTPGRNGPDSMNEVKAITDFIKMNISKTAEIRFILGVSLRAQNELEKAAAAFSSSAMPQLVRTDHHVRLASKTAAKQLPDLLARIRTKCAAPLKASGNVDSIKVIAACGRGVVKPERYGVSLQQAQNIIAEIRRQPNELRDLLNAPEEPIGTNGQVG